MTKKLTLKIDGMHCTSCVISIEGDLEDKDGVKSAKASFTQQVCEVEFDDQKLNSKDIVETIKKTGYKASIRS